MVEAARPSCRAIARKLRPSALSAASRSLSSNLRCVPPDIAPSRFAVLGQSLTTRPRDVALHAGLRRAPLGDRGRLRDRKNELGLDHNEPRSPRWSPDHRTSGDGSAGLLAADGTAGI